MIPRLALSGAVVAGACLLATSCTVRRDASAHPRPAAPLFGVYKSRLENSAGDVHRFRLLLYAELPDRLHGEILTPLGATRMIVDGGGGRLAVTLVPQGISYVGPASSEVLERILGVRLTLEELVGGLIAGETNNDTYTLRRAGRALGLPETLEIRTAASALSLRLKRLRPLETDAHGLGDGRPPDGTDVRPLDQLELEVAPPASRGSTDDGC